MSNAANHQPRRAGILEEDIQEELRDLEKAEREVDASAPDLKQIVKMLDGICALSHWYIRTISRTWSLLEGIWDGCNVSTRVAIDGIVKEKLLKVDKIASGRGNGKFRDLIKEMPTPSRILQVVEQHHGKGNWNFKLPRGVLDQVLNECDRKDGNWKGYKNMRKDILAHPVLYHGWDRLEASTQFGIIKRIWDLFQRAMDRRTTQGPDLLPFTPQQLLESREREQYSAEHSDGTTSGPSQPDSRYAAQRDFDRTPHQVWTRTIQPRPSDDPHPPQ